MTLVGLAARKLSLKKRNAKLASAFPNGVRCQKCLEFGHWSYECKADKRTYLHRTSRSKQLNKRIAEKTAADQEKNDAVVRASKAKRARLASGSSSSSDSESSTSSSDSESESSTESSESESPSSESNSSTSSSSSDTSSSSDDDDEDEDNDAESGDRESSPEIVDKNTRKKLQSVKTDGTSASSSSDGDEENGYTEVVRNKRN